MYVFSNNTLFFNANWNVKLCLLYLSRVGATVLRIVIQRSRTIIEIDSPLTGQFEIVDFNQDDTQYQRVELYQCQVFWKCHA